MVRENAFCSKEVCRSIPLKHCCLLDGLHEQKRKVLKHIWAMRRLLKMHEKKSQTISTRKDISQYCMRLNEVPFSVLN
jgi:hypothetical protein